MVESAAMDIDAAAALAVVTGDVARASTAEQALEGNDLDGAILRAERGAQAGASGEPLGRTSRASARYVSADSSNLPSIAWHSAIRRRWVGALKSFSAPSNFRNASAKFPLS